MTLKAVLVCFGLAGLIVAGCGKKKDVTDSDVWKPASGEKTVAEVFGGAKSASDQPVKSTQSAPVSTEVPVETTGKGKEETPDTTQSLPVEEEILTNAPLPEGTDEKSFKKAMQQVEDIKQTGDIGAAVERFLKMQAHFPERSDEIAGMIADMKDVKREIVGLSTAIDQLGQDDSMAIDVAKQKMAEAGDTGKIVLRKTLRDGADKLAGKAAVILADMDDERAAKVMVARLLKNPNSSIRPQLIDGIRRLAPVTSVGVVAPLLGLVKSPDIAFAQRDVVSVLGVYFERGCDGKGEKFDKIMGKPGAFETLTKYVDAAVSSTSKDPELLKWTSEQAAIFQVMLFGIHAQYYTGQAFKDLALERLDEVIDIPDRKFPYPDNRQDDISVRWSGKLRIDKAGKYTFHVRSDDGNRLLIDQKKIFDQSGTADLRGEVELEKGLHDIVIEYQQAGGGAFIIATWSGPGFQETRLDKSALRVYPWPGLVRQGPQPDASLKATGDTVKKK